MQTTTLELSLDHTEKRAQQLDPKRVGNITRQERSDYFEKTFSKDLIGKQYMGTKASAAKTAKKSLPGFFIFLTKALGRDVNKDPVTPSEFHAMRRAEKGDIGSHLPTYKMIMSYMDWQRHTCIVCGTWIDKDPKKYQYMPCDCIVEKSDSYMKVKQGEHGHTYSPGTRNTNIQNVRGFLRNTAGSAPFGTGDNFWEWGENVIKKRDVSIKDIRKLEQAGNDTQRILTGGWLCTGMSGDLKKVKVTKDLLEQLSKDPLPDVVLIPFFRSKTQGRQERSLRKRYVGFVGIWVQHLAAYVRKKDLKIGDSLIAGNKGEPMGKDGITKAWQNLKGKANIKEDGERFTPHVLRAYAFTVFTRVKDHEFARYITGKKCDKSIVTYYNSQKEMIIEILQEAKRYLDPYAAMQEENEVLRKRHETIEEKITRLEAESRAKDNLILGLREDVREIKREATENPAQVLVSNTENPQPGPSQIEELKQIVKAQQDTIQQMQAAIQQITKKDAAPLAR